MLSPDSLAVAKARSRALNFVVVAGKSSRIQIEITAKPLVAAPSTMNSHLQPARPHTLSRPDVIVPAIIPPKAPDSTAALMYTANRLDCSSFLYQDDKRSRIPIMLSYIVEVKP